MKNLSFGHNKKLLISIPNKQRLSYLDLERKASAVQISLCLMGLEMNIIYFNNECIWGEIQDETRKNDPQSPEL